MIHRTAIALLFSLFLSPLTTQAFVIYDSFGYFPDATWGGTGIPNDAVAASMQIVDGTNTLRVAMSATERYSNPAVSDNGAAIYTAGTGSNFGGAGESTSAGALWNWNFFIDIAGGGVLADYQIDLYYDLDPAGPGAFGDLSGLGKFDITAYLIANSLTGLTTLEDSQNNQFGFWATDFLPILDAPSTAFDPNAVGNYQYAITVTRSGFAVDTVAMEVNTVVPVPAALWLFGSAIAGLVGVRLKQS